MTNALEQWAAQNSKLTELLGLQNFEVVIECSNDVEVTDIKVSMGLVGTGHRIEVPIDFTHAAFARGDTIHLNLPLKVNIG